MKRTLSAILSATLALPLAALLSGARPALAQSKDALGTSAAALSASPAATINGELDSPDGTPVAGATVRLRRTSVKDVVSQTDARGRFTFIDLAPASVVVMAILGSNTSVTFVDLKPGTNDLRLTLDNAHAAPADKGPAETSAPPKQAQPSQPKLDKFCQAGPGADYSLDLKTPTALINVVEDIIKTFGPNIAVDPAVQQTTVRMQLTAPWTSILNLILEQNDLEAQCLPGQIVRILSRAKLEEIETRARKNSPLVRATFTLKNIQPTTSAPVGPGGQPQTGGGAQGEATTDSIEAAIREVLKADGDTRGVVRRVPGQPEFIVIGTQSQIDDVSDLIRRFDRPAPRIEINALVYTVSEDVLKDLGSEISAVGRAGNSVFGITTTPGQTTSATTTGTGTGPGAGGNQRGGLNPFGVPTLPGGSPSGSLAAAAANTLFGGSTLVGSVQFNAVFSLVNTKGAITSQSRQKAVVRNGGTVLIEVGQQIPVVTQGAAGGALVPVGNVQYIHATRNITVTPQVGEPGPDGRARVVLTVKLENNTVNTALGTFGGATLPAIDSQSMQTELMLADNETAILGGQAIDITGNSRNRTPGLANVPVIGHLFERNQTTESKQKIYFAIRAVVIPADDPVSDLESAPADAIVSFPPPPPPARPGPFDIPKKANRK